VIFREAERFDLRAWVRHLLRDKEPTPTGGEALLCFAVMLTLAWFLTFSLGTTTSAMAAGQVGFILTPPLAMALLLTSSPRRTLRLYWPPAQYLALAVGLALALNPLVNELRPVVEWLFPISATLKAAFSQLMGQAPGLGTAVVVFALIPAVCEELAFRGFILSGLEREHRTRSAILLSALMFGFLHVLLSLFQQLFNATLLGIVLGLLAVRSRSLLPGIVFHFVNNALTVALGYLSDRPAAGALAGWLYRDPAEGLYHGAWIAASVLLSGCFLYALWNEKPERPARGPGPGP
jgi:sodium transport system permease protein